MQRRLIERRVKHTTRHRQDPSPSTSISTEDVPGSPPRLQLATARFIRSTRTPSSSRPPGTGRARSPSDRTRCNRQGHRVLYREARPAGGSRPGDARRDCGGLADLALVPCSSSTTSACASCASAAEDLLELVMRRYERTSTILASNRPVEDGASCSATTPPSRHARPSPSAPTSSSAGPGCTTEHTRRGLSAADSHE